MFLKHVWSEPQTGDAFLNDSPEIILTTNGIVRFALIGHKPLADDRVADGAGKQNNASGGLVVECDI